MFGKGKLCFYSSLPLLMVAALFSALVDAETGDDAYFQLKPKSCIAISEGKDCYGDLTLSWKLPSPKNVCLFLESRERPIFCWSKRLAADYSTPFVLSKTSRYSLVDVESKEVLFTDSIAVTWVHKESRKRRRWRLF